MPSYEDIERETRDDLMDSYEKEAHEERLQEVAKYDRAQQEYYARKQQAETNQEMQQIVQQVLKSEGMTQSEFAEYFNGMNPEEKKRMIAETTRRQAQIAKKAAGRTRNAKGQFQPSGGPSAPSPRSETPAADRIAEISNERRKGLRNSDQALLDVVKAVLPSDDPFWRA